MRFALLGDDPQAITLAEAAVAAGHELTWTGESRAAAERLARLAPAALRDQSWESLVAASHVDALLVGRSASPERIEQVRLLAQAGVAMLIVHPLCLSPTFHFELDMIREETRGVLRPYLPQSAHPAVPRMASLCRNAEVIGMLEQVVLERTLEARDKEAVMAAYAQDIDLLQQICGPFERLGALGVMRGDEAAYRRLAVQMTTSDGLGVRWSVGPPEGTPGALLTLAGGSGAAVLTMFDDRPWRLQIRAAESPSGMANEESFDAPDSAAAAIDSMAAAVEQGDDGTAWLRAARSIELVDAVERSVEKGRTIELYEQRPSEAATFKGMMSAAGCGLLLLGLLLMLLVALGDALGLPLTRYWYVALLAVLAVFLLLQLLPSFVLRERDSDRQ
ncbi:MAG: hypothetical protein WDZ59_10385 [Pirellulales bacterium]